MLRFFRNLISKILADIANKRLANQLNEQNAAIIVFRTISFHKINQAARSKTISISCLLNRSNVRYMQVRFSSRSNFRVLKRVSMCVLAFTDFVRHTANLFFVIMQFKKSQKHYNLVARMGHQKISSSQFYLKHRIYNYKLRIIEAKNPAINLKRPASSRNFSISVKKMQSVSF